MSSPGWALLLVRRSLSIRFVFTHPSDSPLSLHGVSVHPASPAERPLWPKEPQSIRPLYVCVSRFYALALAEGFLLKWLNGADHLVQAGRRRMFLVSEVCVLTWARVQAWVSEHAACAHVLTLWIFPGTQMIPFLTLSPPPNFYLSFPQHTPVMFYWIPLHLVQWTVCVCECVTCLRTHKTCRALICYRIQHTRCM